GQWSLVPACFVPASLRLSSCCSVVVSIFLSMSSTIAPHEKKITTLNNNYTPDHNDRVVTDIAGFGATRNEKSPTGTRLDHPVGGGRTDSNCLTHIAAA